MALPTYLTESLSLRGRVNGKPCFVDVTVINEWKTACSQPNLIFSTGLRIYKFLTFISITACPPPFPSVREDGDHSLKWPRPKCNGKNWYISKNIYPCVFQVQNPIKKKQYFPPYQLREVYTWLANSLVTNIKITEPRFSVSSRWIINEAMKNTTIMNNLVLNYLLCW